MLKMYKADVTLDRFAIEEVEAIRFTKKSYWDKNGRHSRVANPFGDSLDTIVFESREEAIQRLIFASSYLHTKAEMAAEEATDKRDIELKYIAELEKKDNAE